MGASPREARSSESIGGLRSAVVEGSLTKTTVMTGSAVETTALAPAPLLFGGLRAARDRSRKSGSTTSE
jgi:hypothetical protein